MYFNCIYRVARVSGAVSLSKPDRLGERSYSSISHSLRDEVVSQSLSGRHTKRAS